MQVSKWGNSLAVRIPNGMATALGWAEGATVELVSDGTALVIRPASPAPFELDRLLAGVTPDNLHGEQEWGPAVGGEEW